MAPAPKTLEVMETEDLRSGCHHGHPLKHDSCPQEQAVPRALGGMRAIPRLCRRVRNQALRLRLAQLCLGAGFSNTAKKKKGQFMLVSVSIPQVPKEKHFLSALAVFFFHRAQQ